MSHQKQKHESNPQASRGSEPQTSPDRGERRLALGRGVAHLAAAALLGLAAAGGVSALSKDPRFASPQKLERLAPYPATNRPLKSIYDVTMHPHDPSTTQADLEHAAHQAYPAAGSLAASAVSIEVLLALARKPEEEEQQTQERH